MIEARRARVPPEPRTGIRRRERASRRRVVALPEGRSPGPSENIRRTATFVERYQTAVSPQPLGLAEKTGVPAMISTGIIAFLLSFFNSISVKRERMTKMENKRIVRPWQAAWMLLVGIAVIIAGLLVRPLRTGHSLFCHLITSGVVCPVSFRLYGQPAGGRRISAACRGCVRHFMLLSRVERLCGSTEVDGDKILKVPRTISPP